MRNAWPLIVFAAMLLVLAFSLDRDPDEVPSPFIGKMAPAFELPSLLEPGKIVSPANYAGQAFVVNVWGSWCPACYDEHELLLEIAAEQSLPIVGLNWKDTREGALNWLQQLGNPYSDVAFDESGDAGIDWGVYGAPETFLVDANGIIVHKFVGPLTRKVWQNDFLQRAIPKAVQ